MGSTASLEPGMLYYLKPTTSRGLQPVRGTGIARELDCSRPLCFCTVSCRPRLFYLPSASTLTPCPRPAAADTQASPSADSERTLANAPRVLAAALDRVSKASAADSADSASASSSVSEAEEDAHDEALWLAPSDAVLARARYDFPDARALGERLSVPGIKGEPPVTVDCAVVSDGAAWVVVAAEALTEQSGESVLEAVSNIACVPSPLPVMWRPAHHPLSCLVHHPQPAHLTHPKPAQNRPGTGGIATPARKSSGFSAESALCLSSAARRSARCAACRRRSPQRSSESAGRLSVLLSSCRGACRGGWEMRSRGRRRRSSRGDVRAVSGAGAAAGAPRPVFPSRWCARRLSCSSAAGSGGGQRADWPKTQQRANDAPSSTILTLLYYFSAEIIHRSSPFCPLRAAARLLSAEEGNINTTTSSSFGS